MLSINFSFAVLFLARLFPLIAGHSRGQEHPFHVNTAIGELGLAINGVNATTRMFWMRQANGVLSTPCPFAAFGAAIVNHTGVGLGKLVCTGENSNRATGDPTLHGEIAAIANCSRILTDPHGPYNLTASQALAAFADFTLYTNAESCPMCASAIRWAGFKEYVYGTSIDTLIRKGWGQIRIPSIEVFTQSFDLPRPTRLLGEILLDETDPLFSWQFDPSAPCPEGCSRNKAGTSCVAN